jgi:hypothetical protein
MLKPSKLGLNMPPASHAYSLTHTVSFCPPHSKLFDRPALTPPTEFKSRALFGDCAGIWPGAVAWFAFF